MDGIKLERWKQKFEEEAEKVQIEFDSFFKNKKLKDYYKIKMDVSDEWSLVISEDLPSEIRRRLEEILGETKPEDSI